MSEQGRILGQVAQLVDEGRIQTTATSTVTPINAANLVRRMPSLRAAGRGARSCWRASEVGRRVRYTVQDRTGPRPRLDLTLLTAGGMPLLGRSVLKAIEQLTMAWDTGRSLLSASHAIDLGSGQTAFHPAEPIGAKEADTRKRSIRIRTHSCLLHRIRGVLKAAVQHLAVKAYKPLDFASPRQPLDLLEQEGGFRGNDRSVHRSSDVGADSISVDMRMLEGMTTRSASAGIACSRGSLALSRAPSASSSSTTRTLP